MEAIALQDTKLTKDLVDSSQVTDPNRSFLVSKGDAFTIRAIAPHLQSNKRLVSFSQGLGKAQFNTWFLFPAHWQIDGEPRADFQEATVPRAASESTPIIKKDIDWWDSRTDFISRYFTEHDVTNGDDRRIPVTGSDIERNILAMALELDKIRAEWGAPIGVTSWHRPPAVNREVGGATFSQHITGGAADIYTLDGKDYEFEDFLDAHWGGGLGYGVASGRGFTHLDLREGGWRRGPGTIRWTY
jgi:putative chitinase